MLEKSIHDTVTENPPTNTFHLLKCFYNKGLENISDFSDDIIVGNTSTLCSQRLSMMFLVPGTEKGIDEEEAPNEAIRRMNEMIRSLINKYLSVKFGPWIGKYTKNNPLLIEFPEDVDIVERYIFDFNRFVSPGERTYVHLHRYYSTKTSICEIEAIISGF